MWISKIQLVNVRCFKNITIDLSKSINVFIGANNSGKSTIAYAALSMQEGPGISPNDCRIGANTEYIEGQLEDASKYYKKQSVTFKLNLKPAYNFTVSDRGNNISSDKITATEPSNFIYPFLSRRKVVEYDEQIDEARTVAITGDFKNIYAKVDRVSNPETPAYDLYVGVCKKILGFAVTCASSPHGKKACYIIDDFQKITIDRMGEGVANILGLLVDICVAGNNLLVIEEPENDLHPKALKEILRFIIDRSGSNQFIITTHSNIVARFLGAEKETKLFGVEMRLDGKIPTSDIVEIREEPFQRRALLESLGYDLIDLDLWSGWVFFEEASAEKIIREHLIRWFTPKLKGRIRTYSARTVNEVELKFENFNRLFSFLNMQPAYVNRAWIIIDNGDKERRIIERLKDQYVSNGWDETHFMQFEEHDFERYYPDKFAKKVEEVLLITDKNKKRERKLLLLEEVEYWIKENDEEARDAFNKSAREVIEKLHIIEEKMGFNE